MRDTQCLHGYVRTAQSVCTVNFKQFGFKTQHCAIQWFGCGRGRVRVRGRVSIRLPNARKGQTCTWTQSMQIGEWQQAHMQPAQLMEQTSRSRKREVNIQTCLPELVANVSRSSFNLQTSRSITWLTSRVSWVRVQSASTKYKSTTIQFSVWIKTTQAFYTTRFCLSFLVGLGCFA